MQRIKHTIEMEKMQHCIIWYCFIGEVISKSRLSIFIRGSKHLETIEASRCLETLMKHWHSFLKYYFYHQTFSSLFQQRYCSFITERQCYLQVNMS